jgi:sugar phosphate isomerase/epimerase
MQSIWRGVFESIFGSENDRKKLIDYTKKAIDFASAIQCENLVFGCPGNRIIPSPDFLPVAFDFFAQIGEYANSRGTVLAIEPNPPYYNTNFINTTEEAFSFCRKLNSKGVKVNVDIGTCLNYNESVDFLNENITLVNHIHISEPLLAPIKKRSLHRELKKLRYDRYFSIEMANVQNIEIVKEIAIYVKEALNDS